MPFGREPFLGHSTAGSNMLVEVPPLDSSPLGAAGDSFHRFRRWVVCLFARLWVALAACLVSFGFVGRCFRVWALRFGLGVSVSVAFGLFCCFGRFRGVAAY